MIEVKLVDHCLAHPLAKTQYAARLCYEGVFPEMKSGTDVATLKYVERSLFLPGHHTTLQHSLFSFQIEGIAVGDVTFGLHLVSPFYNTDQRSGRFCSDMFVNPDYVAIEEYVRRYWPEVPDEKMARVMSFVRNGVSLYQSNIGYATTVADVMIRKERPHTSSQNLSKWPKKIAQEQLRNLIPVVFPTGLVFSIDLTALVSMWESAWTPVLRHVTDGMRDEVLVAYPELSGFFDPQRRAREDWSPTFAEADGMKHICKDSPILSLNVVPNFRKFVSPEPEDTHHVDRLRFRPVFLDNSMEDIDVDVHISVATMGQDQRHRTIDRGIPSFTGEFYLPPIMEEIGLSGLSRAYMEDWWKISHDRSIPRTLATVLAPYGAMVTYRKKGSLNAVIHEQGKRLCWCAQQEIYEIGRQLRRCLETQAKDEAPLHLFEPPCYRTGKCVEGDRYCGRDISKRESGDYFPARKV